MVIITRSALGFKHTTWAPLHLLDLLTCHSSWISTCLSSLSLALKFSFRYWVFFTLIALTLIVYPSSCFKDCFSPYREMFIRNTPTDVSIASSWLSPWLYECKITSDVFVRRFKGSRICGFNIFSWDRQCNKTHSQECEVETAKGWESSTWQEYDLSEDRRRVFWAHKLTQRHTLFWVASGAEKGVDDETQIGFL